MYESREEFLEKTNELNKLAKELQNVSDHGKIAQAIMKEPDVYYFLDKVDLATTQKFTISCLSRQDKDPFDRGRENLFSNATRSEYAVRDRIPNEILKSLEFYRFMHTVYAESNPLALIEYTRALYNVNVFDKSSVEQGFVNALYGLVKDYPDVKEYQEEYESVSKNFNMTAEQQEQENVSPQG